MLFLIAGMVRVAALSTVNFDDNTVSNLVIAPLGPDGRARVYNGSSMPVQVGVDLSGFVGPIPGP